MALYGNNDLSYIVISGTQAGTTVIKVGGAGHLGGVYVGQSSTGTVSYYDGPGTAGTLIAQVANNGTKVPDLFFFGCRVTNGLTAILSAGTTNQTVTWD